MRITVFRRSFRSIVQCTCGFRQSVANDKTADHVAARHVCKPKPSRSRTRSASANSASGTNDW